MGQIWAAIKGLGAIASLISELLKYLKEWNREKKIEKADDEHAKNAQRIDDAFRPSAPSGVQDPSNGQSR